MENNYFYTNTIRNILVAFMNLFNKIQIKRYDDNGEVSKTIDVPVKFGPLSKYYMKRREEESGQRYYVQLPTMAVTMTNFSYSQERAVSTKVTRTLINPDDYDNAELFLTDLMPSPWDISFSLSIRTESFQDFSQIVEQIIPFFNPSVYLRVKEFDSVNLERNIRVTLNGMSPEFEENIDEEGKRYVNGQLTFEADAWFYRPIYDSKIIRKIQTKYGYDPRANMYEFYNTFVIDNDLVEEKLKEDKSSTSGSLNEKYSFINKMVDGEE